MGTFLLLCIVGVVALMVVGSVIGGLLHALFWIATLPFRILFKLLMAPVVGVAVLIGLVFALLGAILSLLTPFLLVLLLGGFAWDVHRLGSKRPSAPHPPPGFWS